MDGIDKEAGRMAQFEGKEGLCEACQLFSSSAEETAPVGLEEGPLVIQLRA